MDEMQFPDFATMNRFTKFGNIISWQQTREIMLASLRPYLNDQRTTSQELWPLPIDDNYKEEHTTEISNEDVNWYNNFIQQNKGEH